MDPMSEMTELQRTYAQMLDGELVKLERDKGQLSPTAQGILQEELRKRGLGTWGKNAGGATAASTDSEALAMDPRETQFVDGSGQVYTYKVVLKDCESVEEAYQRREMLRRSGIDCWLRQVYAGEPPSIEVAADQAEDAAQILEQPIPQDVIDQVAEEMNLVEFEVPRCPKCGDEEPLLMAADPANHWQCESCGHEWSEGE